MTKYIFVTGGVVSSIGKGIVAASLVRLLKKPRIKSYTQLKSIVHREWTSAIFDFN